MTVNLEEKINYLSNELNFKLQIKTSYIMWSLGLEGSGDTRKAGDFYRFCNDFFSVWESTKKQTKFSITKLTAAFCSNFVDRFHVPFFLRINTPVIYGIRFAVLLNIHV